MKHITFYLFLFLSACFYSCDQERSGMNGEKGYLYLDIEKNVTLQTKAYNIDLNVLILDEAEDTVKFIPSFDQTAENDNILLEAGAYQVVITSGSPDSAVWETPYFYGKEDFKIVANEVSVVKVTCKIANTKVTVDYSDAFKNYFTDYSTTVSNVSGSLEYKKGETRGGFFGVDKLTTLLKLINKDGQNFELKRVFPDIKERCHYKLKFSIGEDVPGGDTEAGGNFDITVDETADTVFVRIPIEVEDLENLKVPEFTLTGFDNNNVLAMKAGVSKPHTLTLNVKNNIDLFNMTIQSDQLNQLGLDRIDFTKLTSDEQAKLESIAFPIPDVSETELKFDLEEMSSILLSFDESIQSHTFTFYVMDKKHQEQTLTITYEVKPNRDVVTENPESLWATFAVLKGSSEYVDGLGFEYKELSGEEWTEVLTNIQKKDDVFTALITGLKARKTYVYRAIGNSPAGIKVYGNEVRFTTDFMNIDDKSNLLIPNLGFENWAKNGKTWFPGTQAEANALDSYWDSGNQGGTTSIMNANPTYYSEVIRPGSDGSRSVIMSSQFVGMIGIGKFAAGNIYTGQYMETFMDPMGARIRFGRPNPTRPTQLKGWYKYSSGNIDYVNGNKKSNGEKDKCSIYIALSDVAGYDGKTAYEVNTTTGIFPDLKTGENIIAYGELPASMCTGNDWMEFAIDIVYRKGYENRVPKYVIIVASASYLGDYFTGSTSSVLYIDDFELGYDYNPASFVGTELEGLEPANKQIKDK